MDCSDYGSLFNPKFTQLILGDVAVKYRFHGKKKGFKYKLNLSLLSLSGECFRTLKNH